MKIAVIGSREFDDYNLLKDVLFDFTRKEKIVIVSGGAKGADSLAKKFAKENGLRYIEFAADWYNLDVTPCKIKIDKNGKEYNCLAGFARNKDIISNADMVVAFHNGVSRGTLDSLEIARQQKKNTLIIYF